MSFQNPYQPPQNAPQPGGPPGAQFEFSEAQNKTIKDLANWLLLLGVFLIVGAAGKVAGQQRNVLGATLDLVVALLTILSSSAFRRVVTTQGSDVPNLIEALDKLGTVMLIRSVAAIIGLVILAVAAIAVVALLSVGHGLPT